MALTVQHALSVHHTGMALTVQHALTVHHTGTALVVQHAQIMLIVVMVLLLIAKMATMMLHADPHVWG